MSDLRKSRLPERLDWQYDYAPDTGDSAICPKCHSDDVELEYDDKGRKWFFVCNSCGFKEDTE